MATHKPARPTRANFRKTLRKTFMHRHQILRNNPALQIYSNQSLLGYSQEENTMSRQFHRIRRCDASQILTQPKIGSLYAVRESELMKVNLGGERGRVPIKDADSLRTVGKWTHPHLDRTFRGQAVALYPRRILIHGDHRPIRQKITRLRSHRG